MATITAGARREFRRSSTRASSTSVVASKVVSHAVTVGVISDTHGLVRPQAIDALRGSDVIVHAGDVGTPDVLEPLRAVAPTFAVRGNVDMGAWSSSLPLTRVVEAGGVHIYVLHDLSTIDCDPAQTGCSVVVSGHSHRPSAQTRDGVLYLNPGSAGPRRFSLPVCVARLQVNHGLVSHRIIELQV